jgi:hypothetical protein
MSTVRKHGRNGARNGLRKKGIIIGDFVHSTGSEPAVRKV